MKDSPWDRGVQRHRRFRHPHACYALGHLSPRDRAIIVLRYWEDHNVQAAAELLGLSPGVVKTRSVRAPAGLRVLLGGDEVLPAPPA